MPSVARRKQVKEYLEGRAREIRNLHPPSIEWRVQDAIPPEELIIIQKWITPYGISNYYHKEMKPRLPVPPSEIADQINTALQEVVEAQSEEDISTAIESMGQAERIARLWAKGEIS